jgi:hypothetical protein
VTQVVRLLLGQTQSTVPNKISSGAFPNPWQIAAAQCSDHRRGGDAKPLTVSSILQQSWLRSASMLLASVARFVFFPDCLSRSVLASLCSFSDHEMVTSTEATAVASFRLLVANMYRDNHAPCDDF